MKLLEIRPCKKCSKDMLIRYEGEKESVCQNCGNKVDVQG